MSSVLRVYDQAGVAFTLAKYQQLQGYDSKVITTFSSDKYGIREFYKDYVLSATSEQGLL
jgi:hypothetical protein